MHIKEIILDGFKSYPNKTSITGFDEHFNAITGLNGSGKSNIFDALCFILGISSLSTVRASTFQDLVYKKGMAGIEKASVTVIFDNKNKKNSPLGMSEFDEITVSRTIFQGKSKYFLNGYTVQLDKIKGMFQSVQMNINNPHFMVMQGRIRAVVSMKPVEILGLLEESAGTSTYQIRKNEALKMIKKKENKVEEINKIITEEISPKIDQLAKDKENYQKWKTSENEITRISKINTAYEFYMFSRSNNDKNNEISQYKKQREEMQENYNKLLQEIEIERKNYKQLEEKRDKQLISKQDSLKEEKTNLEKEIDINKNKERIANNNLTKVNKDIETYSQQKDSIIMKINIENKNKSNLESNQKVIENNINNQKEVLSQIEIALKNLNKEDDTGNNLEDQNLIITNAKLIQDVENNKKNRLIEKNGLNENIQLLKNENKNKLDKINELKSNLKNSERSYKNIKERLKKEEENLKNLNISINNNYNSSNKKQNNNNNNNNLPILIQDTQKNISQKQIDLQKFEKEANDLMRNFPNRIDINYRDPAPNFDRKKVKGTIIKNFTVKNPKYYKSLEKAAGNKLYNIIVDSNITGGLLLSNKCFDYMVTLLPMNKINPSFIDNNKLREIKDIFKNEAEYALDLIDYDKNLEPVMKYVFGNVMICSTLEIAQKIAFGKYRVKCVTIDGDIYDPVGLLTGGANFQKFEVLKIANEFIEKQKKSENLKKEIENLKENLLKYNENQQKCAKIIKTIEDLKRNLEDFDKEKMEKKIKDFENAIKNNDIQISNTEANIKELDSTIKKLDDELSKLRKEEQELGKLKGTANKEEFFKKKIINLNKGIDDDNNKIKKLTKEINDKEYLITNLNKELSEKNEELSNLNENISKYNEEIEALRKNIPDLTKKLEILNQELLELKRESNKDEAELNEIQEKLNKLNKQEQNYKLDISDLDDKLKKYGLDIQEAEEKIAKIKETNKWIESEMNFFGAKGTEYDFDLIDIKAMRKNLINLRSENESLKRKVNFKVETMSNEYDKKYEELRSRKDTIISDKQKIEKAIEEMDEERKVALNKVFKSASEKLNKIFGRLLPNAQAKLVSVNEESLIDGVEMRVALGGKWKNSLSELSGGQKSLLALSLILALLTYNPAPIYIFDEIDAALDMNHTANLGGMLKEEFPQSQFIVISLKDGMFSNANVLFRVSFVDGASKVERMAKNVM